MAGGLLLMALLSLASSAVRMVADMGGVLGVALPPRSAELAMLVLSGAWALTYQVGPGAGYFATIVYVGDDRSRALLTAVGNSVRYAAELSSSLCLYSVVNEVRLRARLRVRRKG